VDPAAAKQFLKAASEVGLYTFNPVYPYLESARF
jgi:hypothetical protein